jgi:hypothetical protein
MKRRILPYADEVNLLEDNIDIIHKNRETLTDVSMEVGLEINRENQVYVCVSSLERRHKSGHSTANGSFESVSQFNYIGTIVNSSKCVSEEIKRRLDSDNACYNSAQKPQSFYL